MRVLFLSQLFDPEYSIKGLGFLEEIKQQGADIDVVTTFPNYPTGKVFNGYRVKPWQIEYKNGVRIIRVYSYISHSKSRLARALSYFSFMVSVLLACLVIKKPSIVYAYHPQLTVGLVAIVLKWLRSVPFITDVQDLWPDALAATGLHKTGRMYRLIGKFCAFVYNQAAHIVVLSHGYKAALVERGVSSEKITVVYNWHADESSPLADVTNHPQPSAYQYRFVYAGNLGAAQALKPVIAAFAALENESVSLTVIGTGVEADELRQYAQTIAADNIFFLGYVPADKIQGYLAEADVLVVHLRDDALFKVTIPSKIQAYLSSGKPILAAVGGESNQIIIDSKSGEVACSEDVISITSAARKLVSQSAQWPQMGLNARNYYEREMARSLSVKKIIGILQLVTEA